MRLRLEVVHRGTTTALRAVCTIMHDEEIAVYEETHSANQLLWKSWTAPGGAGYKMAEELQRRGHQVVLGKGFGSG